MLMSWFVPIASSTPRSIWRDARKGPTDVRRMSDGQDSKGSRIASKLHVFHEIPEWYVFQFRSFMRLPGFLVSGAICRRFATTILWAHCVLGFLVWCMASPPESSEAYFGRWRSIEIRFEKKGLPWFWTFNAWNNVCIYIYYTNIYIII